MTISTNDIRPARQTSRSRLNQPSNCEVMAPVRQTAPVVFASPHSGRVYPPEFLASSRLDPVTLRRSEDAFVDEIFAAAPHHGLPLLLAHFPRAYVDPNREAFELDPSMFVERLPDFVTKSSPRIGVGLGTVARVVTSGEEIYKGKLHFAEVRNRIETHHIAYHATLRRLLDDTRRRFGGYLLVDCHSMPSIGGPMDDDPGLRRVDIILGDCHGTSCSADLVSWISHILADLGLRVMRNYPYAGGYTTRHYGKPRDGRHSLQIEINRSLYMDELAVARGPGLISLTERISAFIHALATLEPHVIAGA